MILCVNTYQKRNEEEENRFVGKYEDGEEKKTSLKT